MASVTDGDIRRYILRTGSMEATAGDFANYAPKYSRQVDRVNARALMRKYMITAIPIVDAEMHILDIVSREETPVKSRASVSLPVVMNAGGKGTRLYAYTKILPKPLIPVGELPIA
ncbi:MAG: hypothetical protein VB049_10645 [Candidatus Pelethousia sp.]|nr:hypothetical protein [Candidatus Pelethousia sp.]